MTASVAIVGRPNVGKSTLFNRLVGKRLAIVDDTPGVTRDWREGEAQLGDLRFTVIDTAGLEERAASGIDAGMRAQTERALDRADLVLLLIDARTGLTPTDRHFANWLRRRPQPVILIANKAEGRAGETGRYEAYRLGLGDPIPISAEHGEGMGLLYDALAPHLSQEPAGPEEGGGSGDGEQEGEDEEQEGGVLQLAIVGRPNVGKSTLVNRLLGQERVLTGPEPGVTRDAIAVEWSWRGRPVRLVDTAGLRRHARVTDKLEKLSAADTLRAVRFAQVVVLVLDAQAMLERQDLAIARSVIDEGRALVVAVNKWDLVEDAAAALRSLRERLEASLPQVRGVPVVTLSALTGSGVGRLMKAVFDIYEVWNRRIPTGQLNRWLADMLERHPPPMVAGRPLRLRYITQIKRRPPAFLLFTTRPAEVPEAYLRYLTNGLREAFDLPGVPIRLSMRKGKNPYAE